MPSRRAVVIRRVGGWATAAPSAIWTTAAASRRAASARRCARGLRIAALWASPWCRTRETAALAFAGQPVQDQPAFASFFDEPARREAQTAAAQALLRRWHSGRSAPGLLVVVTHQVNITALTGIHPASGEGVQLRWQGGAWQVAGRIAPP
ncbi:hypothetical protein [Aquabacterium sp. OR-4]|uniref:hypothetical protein n=1 Tax=Aquabacterium sp. OR-4 TaxID=2978127 RepID=UPI0021B3AEAF|nr:hypothetical protein [Aquabacterium sp. OR-4]MDT7838681.1 hypothetical protein [Aquabacterium sp. OR-4]